MEKKVVTRLTMRPVYIAADSITSPLGLSSEENYTNIQQGKSAISLITDISLAASPLYAGWIYPELKHQIRQGISQAEKFTWFEQLAIYAIQKALKKTEIDPRSPRVLFILSTTKGNIELLEQGHENDKRIHLNEAAKDIAGFFGNPNPALVISNACVSGVMAMLIAKRLLQSGEYDHAIVTGADVLTHFVISGFQSLMAISPQPCRPFDINRNGVSLGEAAATVVLTANSDLHSRSKIAIMGGSVSNDANHISGPSRTGEELAMAIDKALLESQFQNDEIDLISAHGTGTLFNDEMEAKAFNLIGLQNTPVNSLKGYFGHTLGAAGIVEAVISIHSMMHDELIPSLGFSESGVSQPIRVIDTLKSRSIINCLKTASGFGGCNAAMVFSKSS